jgi:protein tyrosine/serine phosphatase
MTIDLNTKAGRRQAYKELTWGDHGFLRASFHNMHDMGGGMFRANQPSPKRIAVLAEMGIKTILNLRGESPKGYYLLEKEACAQHGITLIDYRMYSRDVHSPEKLLGAKALFEQIDYPCVMHCKSGSDRTGIMGVLYRHFKMGDSIETALEQLSLRYLHVKAGKTGMLDHFFEDYLAYNAHRPIAFSEWVQTVYDPPAVKTEFMSKWWGRILTDGVLKRE